MLPSGTTGYLQSLDIGINKPFKDQLRKEINNYIEHHMTRNMRGNAVKPSTEEIVRWVKNAWATINDEIVINSLKSAYVSRDAVWADSHVMKHERLSPLISAAMGLQCSFNLLDQERHETNTLTSEMQEEFEDDDPFIISN